MKCPYRTVKTIYRTSSTCQKEETEYMDCHEDECPLYRPDIDTPGLEFKCERVYNEVICEGKTSYAII